MRKIRYNGDNCYRFSFYGYAGRVFFTLDLMNWSTDEGGCNEGVSEKEKYYIFSEAIWY